MEKSSVHVHIVRALQDNYIYVVQRNGSNQALVVDPSAAGPVIEAQKTDKFDIALILNTHHHADHVGGNLELASLGSVPIYCSVVDVDRIPGATRGLSDKESFTFDSLYIETIEIPGHTRGQIAFHIPEAEMIFVGDTLFSMGCGRVFEGTYEQMEQSLQRLSRLPTRTKIYFGHEYTEKNGAFALNVEPDNKAIGERLRSTRECLSSGRPPAPPTLAEELKVNPFLRLRSDSIRRQLGLVAASDLDVFTSLRRLRDKFQG